MSPEPLRETPRVLLVDDEWTTRVLMKGLLGQLDCEVWEADGASAALRWISEKGPSFFDLVVSDYWMPGENGLELLKTLASLDPTLSVVLMTADEERAILEVLLRQGGSGFLRKPIVRAELVACVKAAHERTRRLRQLRATELEASSLGQSQRLLLERHLSLAWPELEFFYSSKSQASGDFVSVSHIGSGRRVLIASDGSGHELSSAFQSNYFQGLARGMLMQGASLDEVFTRFNELILAEWIGDDGIPKSLAALALEFDFSGSKLGLLNAGYPRPLQAGLDGLAAPLGGDRGSSPLGWFKERYCAETFALKPGSLYLWTDGLADQAEALGVDPLSLATRLLEDRAGAEGFVSGAQDDIAIARVRLGGESLSGVVFLPLVFVEVAGDDAGRVDWWQDWLERSLRLALGGGCIECLGDVLVCFREGLLNALEHGCEGSPSLVARVQLGRSADGTVLRMSITDTGNGHDFDWRAHAERASVDWVTEHRGLIMMETLPSRFEVLQGGRQVAMEFEMGALR